MEVMEEREITNKLADMPGWNWSNDKLIKNFKLGNFREAMGFILLISYEAEQRNHHSEIFNCYNRVEVSLQTHDAGAKVTQKDFELATAIDAIPCKN